MPSALKLIFLAPWSDQYQNSPYNISPESHLQVRRIKEMITK